jgi:hypothetical protein
MLGILLLTASTHSTVDPASLLGQPDPRAQLSVSHCEADESNVSLVQGIVYLCQGDGNSSGPRSGLINQGLPGLGAYPSESAAESNAINGWLPICQSPPFYGLIQQGGPQNNTWGGPDQTSTVVY